jgi:hypothetical protein
MTYSDNYERIGALSSALFMGCMFCSVSSPLDYKDDDDDY